MPLSSASDAGAYFVDKLECRYAGWHDSPGMSAMTVRLPSGRVMLMDNTMQNQIIASVAFRYDAYVERSAAQRH